MNRTLHAPIPLVAIAVTIGLAGCASQLGASPAGSPDPTRAIHSSPELPTVPSADDPVTGEVPEEIMAGILADAADRTGEEPERIEIIHAVSVTCNDGSLGCPEPGMSYTMALVDGYHVILEAGDEELDYRVMAQGGFRLCEGARPGG